MRMKKKGSTALVALFAILAIVGVVMWFGAKSNGNIDLPGPLAAGGAGTAQASGATTNGVPVTIATTGTVDLSASGSNKYTGVGLTENLFLWVNGAKDADTTSPLSLAFNTPYEVYVNASGYYGAKITGNSGLAPSQTLDARLVQFGAPTGTFFDENDQTGQTQAIGAGDEVAVAIQLKAPNEQGFGNCAPIKVCFNYTTNNTGFDSINLIGGVNAVVDQDIKGIYEECQLSNVNSVENNGKVKFDILMEGDDDNNPTGQHATARFKDADYYIDTQGKLACGYIDQNSVDLGTTDLEVNMPSS